MGNNTGIEWTDATWNPIVGCTVVSPGCTNCYAMKMASRIERMSAGAGRWSHYNGTTQPSKAGPVWTGRVTLAHDAVLLAPLRKRRPRRIFVNSMGDLFHESVPDDWIDKVFAVMALAPQHTFQVPTKRSKRMREYMRAVVAGKRSIIHQAITMSERGNWKAADALADSGYGARPLANVWLGVSAEDQARADERIPDLLATPAAVRFVSAEPLLGPIDLDGVPWPAGWDRGTDNPSDGIDPLLFTRAHLDWVIVGGESGPHARPMHPDWARGLRDQCAAAGVPFFFKQHGEWIGVPDLRQLPGGSGPGFGAFDHCRYDPDAEAVRVGKRAAGRLLDGREHDAMPGRQA
jgi:protein gp37